eukprot:TRINITY_DN18214_c0_g1_i1.p1 TRINITY_DN18214_c0_g1~~TRINITY_DN18214_c0_g1_i1.p1  ORF type:complete len:428 (+),score=74.08 TRINITY_DN18214_c0_g1_i1:66-1349(+)
MGAAAKSIVGTIAVVVALFITGSANTILTKVLLTTTSVGADGQEHTFQKPFFGAVNMFFAMSLVMLVYWFQLCTSRYRRQMMPDSRVSLLAAEAQKPVTPMWKSLLLIAPPSLFDLLSMCLMLVGMLYIPASVWQMLRGANIIFAAIFTIIILRRQLHAFHWLGVTLALLGILAVSVAAISSGPADGDDKNSNGASVAFGVGIVVLAQVIQAAQIILEEQLLNDLDMDPLLIVGMEGIWGMLFMVFVMWALMVIPGTDHGHAEDSIDTYEMIKNSATVQRIVISYMVSVATYNVSGMLVTSALSGVMRVMLEATRTLCIWLFALYWHYAVDESSAFGEEWTEWSYLQAFGFLVLVIGQGTYGQKILWPCLSYPAPDPVEEEYFASPSAVRAGTYSSPAPGVSRPGAFASPGRLTEMPDEDEVTMQGL